MEQQPPRGDILYAAQQATPATREHLAGIGITLTPEQAEQLAATVISDAAARGDILTRDYWLYLRTAEEWRIRRDEADRTTARTRGLTDEDVEILRKALATHHDEYEPLEGGPAAKLRKRLEEW